MSLDLLDRRLISCLKLDGRMSYSELGERLGVSEGTARNRLGKLLGSGRLQIVPVVEPDTIGYRLNVWIGVRCRPGASRTVAEGLAQFHAIRYATACAGVYDVICEAVFLSQAEMLQFLEAELQTVEGIVGVETSMVLEIAKTGWEWELREEDSMPETDRPAAREREALEMTVAAAALMSPEPITDAEVRRAGQALAGSASQRWRRGRHLLRRPP